MQDIITLANNKEADYCISDYLDSDKGFYTETMGDNTVVEVVDMGTFDRLVSIERPRDHEIGEQDIQELLNKLTERGTN